MVDVLAKYNLRFWILNLHHLTLPVATGSAVADFLATSIDRESLEEVIAILDHHINGGDFDVEKQTVKSEIYIGWISQNEVHFFGIGATANVLQQSVPLQDLRTIVQLWIEYVEEAGRADG